MSACRQNSNWHDVKQFLMTRHPMYRIASYYALCLYTVHRLAADAEIHIRVKVRSHSDDAVWNRKSSKRLHQSKQTSTNVRRPHVRYEIIFQTIFVSHRFLPWHRVNICLWHHVCPFIYVKWWNITHNNNAWNYRS